MEARRGVIEAGEHDGGRERAVVTGPALLFDLDRTLVDIQSFTDYERALRRVEARIATWAEPPTPPSGWDAPTRRAMGLLLALSGDPRWSAMSTLVDEFEAAAVEESVTMPGLVEALELSALLPRAVVTLLTGPTASAALARHRIDIRLVVGRRPDLALKPAPAQLLEAVALLGADPAATTLVGDSPWDEAAARAAGCRFVGIDTDGRAVFDRDTPVTTTVGDAVRRALGV